LIIVSAGLAATKPGLKSACPRMPTKVGAPSESRLKSAIPVERTKVGDPSKSRLKSAIPGARRPGR